MRTRTRTWHKEKKKNGKLISLVHGLLSPFFALNGTPELKGHAGHLEMHLSGYHKRELIDVFILLKYMSPTPILLNTSIYRQDSHTVSCLILQCQGLDEDK